MRRSWIVLIAFGGLLLVACSAADQQPTSTPVPRNPPALPAPLSTGTVAAPAPLDGTVFPPRTATPFPAGLTQRGLEATMIARATASPLPTAGPATTQTGRPASAVTGRAGLQFELRLPGDTYLAGESGQAIVFVHNQSPERFFVDQQYLTLVDEQGREPDPWPWVGLPMPQPPPEPRELPPGATISVTLPCQLPPTEQAAGHSYALWASTRFARAAPRGPGADSIWLPFESGPVALRVMPPDRRRQLQVRLQADRQGWRLQVMDAAGHRPAGPFWGALDGQAARLTLFESLPAGANDTWSGNWSDLDQGAWPLRLRVWVGAPGYVIATAKLTVPGTGDAPPPEPSGPTRATFASLAAAETAAGFPLQAPRSLPPRAVLAGVQVQVDTYPEGRRAITDQSYRLPDGAWLRLTQEDTTERPTSTDLGLPFWDPEARALAVGAAPGLADRHFGRRVITWRAGPTVFTISAPERALALADLQGVAASVAPRQ